MASDAASQAPLWEPSPERRARANMTRFAAYAGERAGLSFSTYEELHEWSIHQLEDFWAAIWDFCGVRAHAPYAAVLADRSMPGARWFQGAELNYAEHFFAGHDPDAVALLSSSELRGLSQTTRGELAAQVASIAAGLRALGVERGDRVVAYMPNIPETLAALLACASIGAIWSSAAPEFGARAVIDRFSQLEPKVLLAVDGYRYGGRDFDRLELVRGLTQALPGLEHAVLLPYLNGGAQPDALAPPAPAAALSWTELLALGGEQPELHCEPLPFDHPLWVLFSSGTTGLPKGIVHGHGGMLVEQLKNHVLHLDLGPAERVMWFTTTGWMMWNWLVGCLLTGAQVVLFDGNPAHPDLGTLWELAARAGASMFGVSAAFLTACQKAGLEPAAEHDLSALRSVGSTGSPLPPEGFRYVYEHVGADIWLYSTSGGTDVCTAFVGGNPLLPVFEGELQCRHLGCAVEAFDERGGVVIDEVGELVLTEPMPSMPLRFWGDEDGSRYREAYFSMYPGVWRHGDWVLINRRGGVVIYGRSDATINRHGVRMGTSEIYRAVTSLPEIVDALVVDVPGDGGELWMPLFVVLAPEATLDEPLKRRIAGAIREHCSPRHVPDEILAVAEVPRTLSGKVLEVPVKRILTGTPLEQAASRDSLANPGALDYFAGLARERR